MRTDAARRCCATTNYAVAEHVEDGAGTRRATEPRAGQPSTSRSPPYSQSTAIAIGSVALISIARTYSGASAGATATATRQPATPQATVKHPSQVPSGVPRLPRRCAFETLF